MESNKPNSTEEMDEYSDINPNFRQDFPLEFALFDRLPIPVFLTTPSGKIIYANVKLLDLFKIDNHQFLEKEIEGLINKGYQGGYKEFIHQNNLDESEFQLRLNIEVGVYQYIRIQTYTKDKYNLHVCTDITREKEFEEELKFKNEEITSQNEEYESLNEELRETNNTLWKLNLTLTENEFKYSELFNNMQNAAIILNKPSEKPIFLIKEINRQGEIIEKSAKNAMIDRDICTVVPTDLAQGLNSLLIKVYETGMSENRTIKHYHGEKISCWREYFAYRLATSDIVLMFNDLTESKREEQKITQRQNLINYIQEAIFSKVGIRYFETLVLYICKALDAQYSNIAEVFENKELRAIAYCKGEVVGNNMVFPMRGTPCEQVLMAQVPCYFTDITKNFSNIDFAKENNLNYYVGLPLFDSSNKNIGILTTMFHEAPDDPKLVITILKIFAERATAEIGRRIAENTIIQYRHFSDNIIESTPGFVYIFDLFRKDFVYTNKKFIKSLDNNVALDKKNKSLFLETLHKQLISSESKFIDNFEEIDEDRIQEEIFKFVDAEGQLRWFHKYEKVFSYKAEKDQLQIMGTVFDITRVLKSERATQESEIRYKTITENSPDLIIRFDSQAEIIYINQRIEKYTGAKAKTEQKANILDYFHNNNLAMFFKNSVDVIFKEKAELEENHSIHPQNPFPMLNWKFIPEYDSENNLTSVLCVGRDVTNQELAAEELRKAKEAAEQSDKLKSSFLANMSHEIRTPMNGIVGFAQMLDNEFLPVEKRKKYIGIINASVNQLMTIISDIVDISKIEAGLLFIKPENCDIENILFDLKSQFDIEKIERGKSQLDLRVILPRNSSQIFMHTDEVRLRQIFINLIGNALKFTEKGQIEWGYNIEKDNEVKFFVKDTGIGIPQKYHGIIFERFRQVDDSSTRKFGGTGLGLSISKGLVELMGGKIYLESEENVGTHFYFTLPYTESPKKIIVVETPKDSSVYDWRGKTILIVDDMRIIQDYLTEALEETKAKLLFADNGTDGVQICKADPSIDLVLMDIQLPDINGYEATMQIKKLRPDLPVIAQTAYALSGDKDKALASGCNDYITKPIKRPTLLEKISKLMK